MSHVSVFPADTQEFEGSELSLPDLSRAGAVGDRAVRPDQLHRLRGTLPGRGAHSATSSHRRGQRTERGESPTGRGVAEAKAAQSGWRSQTTQRICRATTSCGDRALEQGCMSGVEHQTPTPST